MATQKLFTPTQTIGLSTLYHRVVLAPLTRYRASDDHIPITHLVAEHYAQRAAVRRTLLIAEATLISPQAGGFANVPGIWNDAQIQAWKEGLLHMSETVGSRAERTASPELLEKEGPYPCVGASSIPVAGTSTGVPPRPLTIDEIKQYIRDCATAASNAVHRAGFDGVEIHGAHGFLVDQFLQDVSNDRTDAYGGSIENRARFGLEVIEAIVEKVGAERAGIRFSPWSYAQGMGMDDPIPTFSYFVQQIVDKHPNLAFPHVVEPRVSSVGYRVPTADEICHTTSNNFIRTIRKPRPFISAGGYSREFALEAAEEKGDLVAFGQHYIPNPDLPLRLKKNQPLTKYDRSEFYAAKDPLGYVDYSYAPENEAELGRIPVLNDNTQ